MKTIVYIFSWLLLFGLSGNLTAQEVENPQEELIDNEWYLTKLVIQEEDYPFVPTDFGENIRLEFIPDNDEVNEVGMLELVWDYGFDSDKYFALYQLEENNEFYTWYWGSLALNYFVTNAISENVVNQNLYLNIFWWNNNSNEPFHYQYVLQQMEGFKQLIIINENDDEAHYQNIPFMSVNKNEFSKLNIYPNPLQESFQIENLTEKSNLKIYDLSGKEIFEQEIHSSTEKIEVTQLSSGLYFYGIFQEGRRVKTGKLVKE